MTTDYSHTEFARLYRTETFSFRNLPVMTKAVAAYARTLVDPTHGWFPLRTWSPLERDSLITALRDLTTGPLGATDSCVLRLSIEQLLDQGYLTRCRILETSFGEFRLADGREVPLSHWSRDRHGTWLVITDWVPSEHGLTAAETRAWHELRHERATWTLEANTAATPAPAHRAPELHD